jgi:hypothetical protein
VAEVPEPTEEELAALSADKKEKLRQHRERYDAFVMDRNEWLARRAKESKERALSNVRICEDIRQRFLNSLKQ